MRICNERAWPWASHPYYLVADPIEDSVQPLEFSGLEFQELILRVKDWKFVLEMVFSNVEGFNALGDESSLFAGTISGEVEVPINPSITTELDALERFDESRSAAGFTVVGSFTNDAGGSGNVEATASLQLANLATTVPYAPEIGPGHLARYLRLGPTFTDPFLPSISYQLSIRMIDSANDRSVLMVFNNASNTTGGIEFEFMEEPAGSYTPPKILTKGIPVPNPGPIPASISGSVQIEGMEYWPYDPGDGGGPIWDSADGDKLRPNY